MSREALNQVAAELGVAPDLLSALIDFESGWSATARNPKSSARGLLQFIDSTARSLGYKDSADLVEKNPTIEAQLRGPVKQYLKKYAPFPTEQSLFMAVFYPAARNWEPNRPFPPKVQKANPGIKTPADYLAFVRRRLGKAPVIGGAVTLGLLLFAGILIYNMNKG